MKKERQMNMGTKTWDAVVAGMTCLDITPGFVNPTAHSIGEVMVPSTTLYMDKTNIHTGGCVSNTGLAMNFFGMRVKLMTMVGDDDFGKIILSQYAQYTDTDSIKISQTAGTAHSFVIAPRGIDRLFLHYPGCNDTFSSEDLDFDTIAKARLFHFGYPPVMHQMYRNDGAELIRSFKKAKELDVTTSLDLCGIDENSEAGRSDWRKILQGILPYVDIFMPSIEELCCMVDRDLYHEWLKKAGDRELVSILTEEDILPLMQQLFDWGAKIVLMKCGRLGLYLMSAGADRLSTAGSDLRENLLTWDHVQYLEHSYKPSEVISGSGAGDTCIAAFLTAVLKGCGWKSCLQYAAAAGASCVEAVDALSGLRSFEEMDEKIRSGWEKQ